MMSFLMWYWNGRFFICNFKDVAATAIRFSKLPILKRILDRGLPAEYMGELFVEASILDELEIVQFLGGKRLPKVSWKKPFCKAYHTII